MQLTDESLGMLIPLKLVLLALVFAAGFYDLRVRRIPNWLNLGGLLLGLGLNTYFANLSGTLSAAGGLLVALSIYVPLYALKGMGAGDVKLMAAVGAISGPTNWLYIFLATALIGGVASLVLVLLRKRLGRTFENISIIVAQLARGKSPSERENSLDIHSEKSLRMPHGAIIAVGVCLFLALHWNA